MHERHEDVHGRLLMPGVEVSFPENPLELDIVELAVEIKGKRRVVVQMECNGVHEAVGPAL